jgi:hypothetical protein
MRLLGGMKLALAACIVCAGLVPASASAGSFTLGPPVPTTPQTEGITCSGPLACKEEVSSITLVQRTVPEAGVTLVAPADGVVTSWRVAGSGTVKLRVLHTVGGALTGGGTSAPAADLNGGANATNMPIRAGDRIAVDLNGEPKKSTIFGIFGGAEASATLSSFEPAIPNDDSQHNDIVKKEVELFVNATVALPPAVAGLTPAAGKPAGGETVKIFGSNLDGATGVQFGSKPAIFAVDSPSQITATAPAVPASTVDVTVTGPGGTSAINAGDKYTFTTTPGTLGPGLVSPLTGAKPTLTALSESASRWRRGHQQAKISRAPVGTTFSFNLSKPATVKLAFTKKASGRRVRGACKPTTPSNASKRKCVRTIVAGTLSLPGHAGPNKLRFQGLLPSGKSLKLGRYDVSLTARDSGGLQSAPHSLSFSIVG